MKKLLFLLILVCLQLSAYAEKTITIVVKPKEASIFVDGQFMGRGSVQVAKPKAKALCRVRIQCNGYNSVAASIYGDDKRKTFNYTLRQDVFYSQSEFSSLVNKYFTVEIDPSNYSSDKNGVDVSKAWKIVRQILMNYFPEISISDQKDGGYMQTPWVYKSFPLTEMQLRNRVSVRDISTKSQISFQIRIDSESAAVSASEGEFESIDRIPKDFEETVAELQTRIGKINNL